MAAACEPRPQADSFERRAARLIKKIPRGRVATYGQIALLAGNPRGARQVVRVLNLYSEREKLPWHRVINRFGRIALPEGKGHELQESLLKGEGVRFSLDGSIDLDKYQWKPKISS